MSATQQAQLATLVNHPAKAQTIAGALNDTLGTLDGPADLTTRTTSGGVQPNLAYGWSGDHFWITASYWDIASGTINVAINGCRAAFYARGVGGYAWICNVAGDALKAWGSGWGWAGNHGVWGAMYWWGYFTGGRW